jgi:hypothetical protein
MAKPNDLAACHVTPGSDWILAISNMTRPLACTNCWMKKSKVALANVVFGSFHSIVFAVFSFARFTSRCPWRRRQADSGRRYLCGLPGHDLLLSSDGSAITTKEQSWCLCHGPLCGRRG